MGELLCEVMRPEADMPLDAPGAFLGPYPSGAPAICIDTVARLGHTAGIIGGVGEDDFGKCLLDRLARDGVDCSRVARYPDGSTGVAFVTYFGDGSRRFLYHFADTPATRPAAPDAAGLGDDVRYFHIMGCSLMAKRAFGEEILKLARGLAGRGVKISFDPNIRPELMRDDSVHRMVAEVMQHCSVFLPGVDELLAISGQGAVEDAVKACFENPALEVIALKRGSKGCTLYTRTQQVSMGVYPVAVKDATGAGDSFDGAFLCGLLEGMSLREAGELATAAAALNTAAFGPMEGDISRANAEKMIAESTLA